MNKQHGYTLVEILVVVTIIAVLVGVLLPIMPLVKENSKTSSCASNLRQLGAAMLNYAADWHGTTPPGGRSVDGTILTWDKAIMPNVKSRRIFRCPSDVTKGTRSYAMNDQWVVWPEKSRGIKLSTVPNASKIVMLQDWHHDDNQLEGGAWASHVVAPEPGEGTHKNQSGNNFVFFDGHVDFYKLGQLKNDSYLFDPRPR